MGKKTKKPNDIFADNPNSFHLDRNSTVALKLKATITEKLNQFLKNYTDDVLAEYIIVLVCNGKDQNQARDSLEVFLGERSGEFVAWLWYLLPKYVDYRHMRMSSSYGDAAAIGSYRDDHSRKKNRRRPLRGHHHHHANSNDEKEHCSSSSSQSVSSTDSEFSEGSQSSDTKTEGQTQTFKHGILKKPGPVEDNSNDVLKLVPSRVEVSSGISAGSKQILPYVDGNKKVSDHHDELLRQRLYLPKKGLREKPKYGTLKVTNVTERNIDAVFHEKAKPRSSVWDRLGKQCSDGGIARDENTDVCRNDIENRTMEDPKEEHDHKKLALVRGGRLKERLGEKVPDPHYTSSTVTHVTHEDDFRRLKHDLNYISLAHQADKTYKKRQFSEIGSGLSNDLVSLEGSKYKHPGNVDAVKQFQRPEIKNSISYGCRQIERQHNVFRRKVSGETIDVAPCALASNRLLTKSEPASNEDAMNTTIKPAEAERLDYMKQRLQKMEMEVSMLKAKHLKSNESKSSSMSSSDVHNHSDEDAESRTVFVTNVHFTATKEALSLHFAKCGVIGEVTILYDTVTSQPKGAAFITFSKKESIDNALALSGTMFLSRPLRVVKKAEMPPGGLASPQPVTKFTWSQSLHANRKVLFPRPFSGSLQWRREQSVTTENTNSALADGLGSGPLCNFIGSVDPSSEQRQGPRASKPKSQASFEQGSCVDLKKNGTLVPGDDIQTYNRADFVTDYNDAKFFIIKSYSEDNVHKSIKYGVWASTPSGNRKLDAAYNEAKETQCPVFVFFSVNASGHFCGVAEMVGPVYFDKSVDYWQQDKWIGQFPVKWHIIKDVPHTQFRHIRLEYNENKPVTNSRDTQEVKLEHGLEMLNIFKSYETNLSILDDFEYYEEQEKVMQEEKARQQATLFM